MCSEKEQKGQRSEFLAKGPVQMKDAVGRRTRRTRTSTNGRPGTEFGQSVKAEGKAGQTGRGKWQNPSFTNYLGAAAQRA